VPSRIEPIRPFGAAGLMDPVGNAGLKDEAIREVNLAGLPPATAVGQAMTARIRS
jgi:hypothetical protein